MRNLVAVQILYILAIAFISWGSSPGDWLAETRFIVVAFNIIALIATKLLIDIGVLK